MDGGREIQNWCLVTLSNSQKPGGQVPVVDLFAKLPLGSPFAWTGGDPLF